MIRISSNKIFIIKSHCRLLSSAKNDNASANYCANNVRKFDFENFLCTLLIRGQRRREALAIRAFNVEIARIPIIVSDSKIAHIRLRFWEDSIAKLFDKDSSTILPEHPVITELSQVVKKHKLTKRYFDRLINSRKMSNLQFITTKQMESYAEESVSSVNYLLLEILDCRNVHADHAASHLGKAQGITNALRSIYLQRNSNQYLSIPQEILMKHGVSQERFFRSKPEDKGVENVVFDIATVAHQHLEKSLALMSKVPKESKIAFLPKVPVQRYLERLRRVNFNLVNKTLGNRDNLLPFALYWSKLKDL